MRIYIYIVFITSFWLLKTEISSAQDSYYTYDALTQEIKTLSAHPQVSIKSYGKSYSGKDLWSVTLGKEGQPALLVVAGIDGSHQAGTLAGILMLKNMLKTDSLMSLLANKSIILIPSANPDAISGFFSDQKYEKSGNNRQTDDDRNGKNGDDGYEDLNKDGLITMMRIESAAGDHFVHPDDPRRMVKSDIKMSQSGTHIYLTEGVDNNKNDIWNEDPSAGVNINNNFAFEYHVFSKNAGEFAVSESETRALMDFIFEHPQIHTIIHLGPHNNLTEPEKYNEKLAGQRIIKSWLEEDAGVSHKVSEMYNNHTSLKNPPSLPHTPGSFTQTAYYHTGNFSFATPFWWATAPDEKSRDTMPSEVNHHKKKSKSPASSDYASTFLAWADQEKINDIFVPWTSVEHPDFKNKKVEVGGLKPYVLFNPPVSYIDQQVSGHTHFFYELLSGLPTHDIVEPLVEKISDNLYRVTLKTVNKGALPSYAIINDKFRFTSRLLTEIKLNDKQKLISGKKIHKGTALQPNQSVEHSWLISGKGTVSISSGSAKTGISTIQFNLN